MVLAIADAGIGDLAHSGEAEYFEKILIFLIFIEKLLKNNEKY